MKLVYIAGYGRSGSTLLGALLAQQPNCVFLGEMSQFWHAAFRRNHLCSCGQRFSDCEYWQEVMRVAYGHEAARIAQMARSHKLSLEHIRNLPKVLAPAYISEPYMTRHREYLDALSRLYSVIETVSGAEALVDSSKIPTYLATLTHVEGLSVRTVHLVRDSRAVAYSWTRKKARPDTRNAQQMAVQKWRLSAMEWNTKNALTHFVRPRTHAYARYRYEDMVSDPSAVLRQMGDRTGIAAPNDCVSGRPGEIHCMNVNPSIFSPEFTRIGPDTEWERKMSPRARRTVTAYTWPLLLTYGYKI